MVSDMKIFLQVVGKNNVWTQVAYSHQHSPMADMDWSEMEGLFCQQPSAHSSPKLGREVSEPSERRIRKESGEVCKKQKIIFKAKYNSNM